MRTTYVPLKGFVARTPTNPFNLTRQKSTLVVLPSFSNIDDSNDKIVVTRVRNKKSQHLLELFAVDSKVDKLSFREQKNKTISTIEEDIEYSTQQRVKLVIDNTTSTTYNDLEQTRLVFNTY